MQTLTGEQYIQPHQAQILPKNDKEDLIFEFKKKRFLKLQSILTAVVTVSAKFDGYIPKTKPSTLTCNKYIINEILLKGTKALQLSSSLIQPSKLRKMLELLYSKFYYPTDTNINKPPYPLEHAKITHDTAIAQASRWNPP